MSDPPVPHKDSGEGPKSQDTPLNSEPSKMTVAVIAAIAAVLAALISSSVTVYVTKKSVRTDTNKVALEYLNRKISSLEQQRRKLIEAGRSKPHHGGWGPGAAAEAVDNSYSGATQAFEEIKHYLPTDVASRLGETKASIDSALTFERAKAHGIIKKDAEWRGPPSKFKSGPDILDAMIKFSRDVDSAVDDELKSSTRRIETIIAAD